MADEAVSVPPLETVETSVLYIRDQVLEWPDRVIALRHIQSVSCDTSEAPIHPDSADGKVKSGTQRKDIGITLCVLSGVFLAVFLLLLPDLIREAPPLTGTVLLLKGTHLAGTALLAAAGAHLIRTGGDRCAEAEKELEEWRKACAEAEKNRYLELVLSSGGRLRFSIGNPDFLRRVFQLLSSKLDNPEDPDGRYKIELDTGKLYRIRLVSDRKPGRTGREPGRTVREPGQA